MSSIAHQFRVETKTIFRVRLIGKVLITAIAASYAALCSGPVFADDPGLPPPMMTQIIDSNGVNLTTRATKLYGPTVSVGQPNEGGLSWTPYTNAQQWVTDWSNSNVKYEVESPQIYTVTLMGQPETFTKSGSTFSPAYGTGGALTYDGTMYTYTNRQGAVAVFTAPSPALHCVSYCTVGLISTLTYADGEKLNFVLLTSSSNVTMQSVTSNLGYQLKANFNSSSQIVSVMAINNAYEYCDPTATTCTPSDSWPTMTYGYPSGSEGSVSVSDGAGHTSTTSSSYTMSTIGGITHYQQTVTRPGGQYLEYDYDNCTSGCYPAHMDVTDGANTWGYQVQQNSPTDERGMTVTDPVGHVRYVKSYSQVGMPIEDRRDPSGLDLTDTYSYDGDNRLTEHEYPEINYTTYIYDSRGNVTEIDKNPVPGSGSPTITMTAQYPSSCDSSNYRYCNKATWVKDANGNETDYTYDSNSGYVATVTGPAVNGQRPLTTYTYTQENAWYKDSSGTIVEASTGVYKLTKIVKCKIDAGDWGSPTKWGNVTWTSDGSCDGTANQIVTTYTYQQGNSTTPSNLQLISTTTKSGDNAVSATASTTYDMYGNVASTTDANMKTTTFYYDLDRHLIGKIGPEVNSSYPATQTTYDDDGNVSKVEQGTTDTQGTNWSTDFTPASQVTYAFDAYSGLKDKATSAYVSGSTVTSISVTQYTYDGARNLECTAVRENSAVFGSLPSSACDQSTEGSYGPDQIAENGYDAAGRLLTVTTGVGTSTTITQTNAYTANSQPSYVEDGSGNRTCYTYDGLDRLTETEFPDKSTAHTCNTSDNEQFTYDDNGNRLTVTLRSGDVVHYAYDALNRKISKIFNSGSSNDVYYGYDLVGDLLYAHTGSAGGDGVDYAYDALGRQTAETEYGRTVTSHYDDNGNRDKLFYPDGDEIDYTYDALNRMVKVEQGSTVLAQYAYDDPLGRETGITRSNSISTAMTYTATSQHWTLAQSGAPSKNVTFGFDYTPGGQLTDRTVNNGNYEYGAASAATTPYCPNGLNQYATVGGSGSSCTSGTSYSYSTNGNLTSDGSRSFTYDLDNRLTEVSGSAAMTLSYDPLGRLHRTVAGSTTEQYLYDGSQLIAEYDGSGNVLRRYVPGQGADETLVWYEGSDLSSPSWLTTDQLGSVIATTNSSGTVTATYAYSATGEPSGGFASGGPAFRYTGQVALAAVGLYYYKARMYDPVLGRFLQTDPVGYSAGRNLYAYVGNDPVNATDPSGLDPLDYYVGSYDVISPTTVTKNYKVTTTYRIGNNAYTDVSYTSLTWSAGGTNGGLAASSGLTLATTTVDWQGNIVTSPPPHITI